jgi:hypothetical protein
VSRSLALGLNILCFDAAQSLEVRTHALRAYTPSRCLSSPRAPNNPLKSALDVSTNTPRQSTPRGTHLMPLRSANEEAKVFDITETAAQTWAVLCAISSDISILAP